MAALDDIWSKYMGLKADRRQRRRDDTNDDRYADQLQQQSLANTRADEQLKLQQANRARADAAVIKEQERYDAGESLRNEQLEQAQRSNQKGKFELFSNATTQLALAAGTNGAEATLSDPTYRPQIDTLIGELLNESGYLEDGQTYSGLEEIAGPTREGKSTKVFVPMMEDANGRKTDIGQMLNGEGADAFTAEQIVTFLQRAGQRNEAVTTDMGITAAAAPIEANAEEAPVGLGTNAEVTGAQQQTQQVETPVVETPVADTPVAASTPDNVTVTALADANVKEVTPVKPSLANPAGVEKPKELNRDITAKNFGRDARTVVDSLVDGPLSVVKDAFMMAPNLRRAATDFIGDSASDLYDGFTGADAETTPTTTEQAPLTLPNSLNNRMLSKQEEKIKEQPPTENQVMQSQSDAIDSARAQQQSGNKKPTQAQRTTRATNIAIRRAGGEPISAEQAERYINTGFIEKGKIDNVTVGQFDYERRITPEGFVTYNPLGASGAAIRAADSANSADVKANAAKRGPIYEAMGVSALGRAAIEVVDSKGKAVTNIGPFHTREDFAVAAMRFIDNNAASLAPYLDFDPTIPNPDLGQQRLLEGVITAYASSLDRSKSGEQIFSNTNDFSKFIKSYSAKSGLYIINNRMVNLDDRVNEQVKNLGGDPARIRETVRAMLAEQQGSL